MGVQPTATIASTARKPRRSQHERSRQMRMRLIEAAIESLARDGYAGASLNAITHTATVSRGAQSHHFPTKQDLLYAVVEHIGMVISGEFRDILRAGKPNASVQRIVELLWQRLFSGNLFRAYVELLLASQRDEGLRATMQVAFLRAREEGLPSENPRLPVLEILLYLSGAGLHKSWIEPSRDVIGGFPQAFRMLSPAHRRILGLGP